MEKKTITTPDGKTYRQESRQEIAGLAALQRERPTVRAFVIVSSRGRALLVHEHFDGTYSNATPL